MPPDTALRHIETTASVAVDPESAQRIWAWLGGLLDSNWGLTKLLAADDEVPEPLLALLVSIGDECRNIGSGRTVDPRCWTTLQNRVDDLAAESQLCLRYRVLRTTTALNSITSNVLAGTAPADPSVIADLFAVLATSSSGNNQRCSAIEAPIDHWYEPLP
ncbi:hypothetical protein ACFWPX_36290 [Nocardia sp. NPDC058518]|uniref:hypothetical protein n=1 Tax=Nocardia sp. NPDC058518 TaxID=3346534 RepID=UPI00366565C7